MIINFLKELFVRFLRARRIGRHFRRLFLLENLKPAQVKSSIPPSLARQLVAAALCEPSELLHQFKSRKDGLSEEEAEAVREKIGVNEVSHEKPLTWWHHLWLCYKTPFDLLLTGLAVISYVTEDIQAAMVISSMVFISVAMRFIQERTSNIAMDKLKSMVSNTATVLRSHAATEAADPPPDFAEGYHPLKRQKQEIPIQQLVPGDVIQLSAGDMIPADCRVLHAQNMFMNQSAMTGESLPVEKYVVQRDRTLTVPLEMENMLYTGTNVVSGSATALVIATGNHTYFGALAQHLTNTRQEITPFQSDINTVAWLLIRFMLVVAPVVFLLNGLTKHDWLEAFLFCLSVAVGLTPEMLPMIATSTLAKGAVTLSRRKVIVKRLDAIQNFGAMDVLCTDKTGTLTQDRIVLERNIGVWGEFSEAVLEYAYLNSYYQTGLKNLLDVAVLKHAEVHRTLQVATSFRLVDEIPFDFQRRRMSVVVAKENNPHLLICKGASEEILEVCSAVRHGEVDEPLTEEVLARIRAVVASLNEEGLRVVAVAVKEVSNLQKDFRVIDESSLTLVGYVAFLDPPKETTQPALQALGAHGVTVKILTGDNALVTQKICREVGFEISAVMLGVDVERMNEAELGLAVERHNVFVKLTPDHKERIVKSLKTNGHVVGFMGDGINDAAALRGSDIGISVDSAVDIAREAADIILLEKSLMVLEEGVIEGRKTFCNMLKYIRMAASSNFGNVFSVLIASAFIPFLPMLPMQLLVQNLLYDISQLAIPFDRVDEELLRLPQHWQPQELGRFMLFFGPLSSVFDIITFCFMWYVLGANTPEQQTLFQSGWFVMGLLTQTLIVHMIRTPKVPFVQSRAAMLLMATTVVIMAIGIFLPMGSFAGYFKLKPLPWGYFVFLFFILLGYAMLTQLMKKYYVRRFGWQ